VHARVEHQNVMVQSQARPLESAEAVKLFLAAWSAAEGWRERVERESLPKGFVAGQILGPADGSKYLTGLRSAMILRAHELISAYSSAAWLWALRCLDALEVFALVTHAMPGSEITIFAVAENLASGSETYISIPMDASSWDRTLASRVARLVALAARIVLIEGWLRRTSKGTELRIRPGSIPNIVHDKALERAIDEFDERNHASVERWHSVLEPESARGRPLLAGFKYYGGWQATQCWSGPLSDRNVWEGLGQFTIRNYDLRARSNIDRIAGSTASMKDPGLAASIAVFANAMFRLIDKEDLGAGTQLPQFGFVCVEGEMLRKYIDAVLAETAIDDDWAALKESIPDTGAGLLEALDRTRQPGRRSWGGPVIHAFNNYRLVDINALTWHLSHSLRLDATLGGSIANDAALQFELLVQGVIDDAGYGPPDGIARLRGRTLRIGNSAVTDVDAFIVVNDVLTLVSCKRIELTRDYDAGDYTSVRNAGKRLEQAVDEWQQKLAIFDQQRSGDNFDFTGFARIAGVVVVPELIFSKSAMAREFVRIGTELRLRRASSVDELADCLEGSARRKQQLRQYRHLDF
jgi:hypothetical protein